MQSTMSISKLMHSIPSVIVGLLVGILAITNAISLIALIFSEDLMPYFSIGIGIALMGVSVLAMMAAWKSQASMIAEPQDTTGVLLMLMVNALITQIKIEGEPSQIFPTVMVLIVLASFLIGLSFFLVGYFQLGVVVRFIPYPIIGGFLAGTGWILMLGSIKVITDQDFNWANLALFFQKEYIWHILAGFSVAGVLLGIRNYCKHFLAIPVALIAFLILFHFIFWITSLSSEGWFLGPFTGSNRLWPALSLPDLHHVNWSLLLGQSVQFAVLIFTAVIALLLNLNGFELVVKRDIHFDQELRTAGFANLVNGCLGGIAGYQSLSLSVLGLHMNVNNRIVGLVSGMTSLAFFFLDLSFFSLIPRAILGGVLLYIGVELLVVWSYDSWYKLPKLDYALVMTILLVIAAFGFLEGVILGIAVAILLFVVEYSSISVVKHMLSGVTYQSHANRSIEQQNFLKEKGTLIYILQLQGFLFFGTSYRIIKETNKRLNDSQLELPQFILVDFRLVSGIDASSLLTLMRLKQLAQKYQSQLVFTQLNTKVRQQIEKIKNEEDGVLHFFASLDAGVEWCEDQILHMYDQPDRNGQIHSLFSRLFLPILSQYSEKLTYQPGQYLIHQGDDSHAFYLIESGQLATFLELPNGEKIRLSVIREGAIVGELGFYLNLPRSASVVVEKTTLVYEITEQALKNMWLHHPDQVSLFQNYLIRILAERVNSANKTIQSLIQ